MSKPRACRMRKKTVRGRGRESADTVTAGKRHASWIAIHANCILLIVIPAQALN
jgi:hypothetical protein